jgi:hypothetical protein
VLGTALTTQQSDKNLYRCKSPKYNSFRNSKISRGGWKSQAFAKMPAMPVSASPAVTVWNEGDSLITWRVQFRSIRLTRFVRAATSLWLFGFGLLPVFLPATRVVAVERVVRQDTHGDSVARRTDPGADGPIDPGLHVLPDLLSYSLGNWQPDNPQTDLYTGRWSALGVFLRFEMVFDGLVNPPGPVGCCGEPSYDPFRYGPNPVSGYVEFDLDNDADTGGEIEVPQLRYLGNTSRFGGLPQQAIIRDRAALDYFAFDGNMGTAPFVERSGEDFHVALAGWEIQSVGIQRSDQSDWTFGAGETWLVPGYLFQRAHGYRQFSSACCRAGAPIGSYEPLVKLEFSHSTMSNRTTVSLVYPLTNAACAAMQGNPQTEPMDVYFTNQNSIQEALFELKMSAIAATPIDRAQPEFALIAGWENKNPDDYLGPAQWRVSVLVGGSYTEPQGSGVSVWSDIYPDVSVGDVNGDAVVNTADVVAFDLFLQQHDGLAGFDGDGVVNGTVQIVGFGPNFSLYDLNYDGQVDDADRETITGGPSFARSDFDHDTDVDQSDFGHLQACLTGLNQGPPSTGCQNADVDRDGDVDESDTAILLGCMAGPQVFVAPMCGR